jgi:hypothetical protein
VIGHYRSFVGAGGAPVQRLPADLPGHVTPGAPRTRVWRLARRDNASKCEPPPSDCSPCSPSGNWQIIHQQYVDQPVNDAN